MSLVSFVAGCFVGSIGLVVACGLFGYWMMRSAMKGPKSRPDVKYTWPDDKKNDV